MNIRTLVVMWVVGIGLCMTFAGRRSYASPGAQETVPHFLQTHWTTENGLPQNSVVAIAQTPDGYLWLGTFGGLVRFDGVKFTIFNTGNMPALPSNRITALHVGRDGVLWVGAETGEITCLRDGNFSFFARLSPDASGDRTIRNIYADRTGAIWVSADRQGLTRFAGGNAAGPVSTAFYDEPHGLPPATVSGMCEDRDGRLWVSTVLGLALFREEGAKKFTIQFKATSRNFLLKIRPHPNGGLWLMTQNSLNRFHDGFLTPYLNFPYTSNVFAPLTETADGELLFSYATDRLFKIERSGAHTVATIAPGQRNVVNVHSLFEDREGNVWVGSVGNGLFRLQRRRVTMLNVATGLPDTGGNSVLEDAHGAMWIGTSNGLCRVVAGQVTTYFTPAARGLHGGYKVGALYEDHNGTLWFGLGNHLVRYRNERFTEYSLPHTNLVSAILEDRQGRKWLGAINGLVRFDDGRVTVYTERDGLVNNDVKFIYEDRAGALWLGTPGGMSRFHNGVFTNYTTKEGLSNNYVRAVYEDRDGALWLGTYGGGLNRLQNGRITHITTKHGLFDDFISALLPNASAVDNERDDFWLLGNRGIFRVSRRALNEFAAGQSKSVNCVVYNEADGMNPSEGNGGHQPAGWQARDGRFYFSTIRGVAVVNPRLAIPNAPPVIIERVLLDGQELDARQPIEIPPGQGNLEIHYTGLSLGKPEQVQFSFKLSGLDESWVDVARRRIAYFPQLQPGQYRFSVKALSPDGVWSEQEASLAFAVRPPFWRTAWFLSLMAMFVIGLALLGYRQRVTQLRRRVAQQETFARQLIASQESERKRIAGELHDGLGQTLVIIKRRAQLCLDAPADHERAREQVQEIVEASTHALDEVKEIIFDLRPQQLDRLGLTGAITDLLAKAVAVHDLELAKELDDIDGLFPKEAENSFFRIVQESINNVVRHAAATRVAVTLSRQPGAVELAIQDNGRGFVVSAQHNAGGSFGLRGIRERARLLGGQAIIESAPGQGTTVWLNLPLEDKHRGN